MGRLNLVVNIFTRDAGFDESKHKRDHGKFAATSGATAEHKVKNAPSLPMGADWISTKSAGLRLNSGRTTVRVPKMNKATMKASKVLTIPIDDIETLQGYLHRPKILSMLRNEQGLTAEKPTVVEQDGKYYLVDGNHRVSTMKLLGKTSVEALVVPARAPK